MKIAAISAMEASKVHLQIAIDLQANRNSTQRDNISPTNAKIELGPTAAARVFKNLGVGNSSIPISSSTPVSASRYVNIVSDPDAVSIR